MRVRMLHTLKPAKGSTQKRKRVARGNSAGGGTTAGRGTKGQDARSGKGKRHKGFEGGQVPLIRRQPKMGGFKHPRRREFEVVTLVMLENLEAGSYDVAALRKARIVRTTKPVKVLGNAVSKKYSLSVDAVSKGAKAAVEKAGGTVTITKSRP